MTKFPEDQDEMNKTGRTLIKIAIIVAGGMLASGIMLMLKTPPGTGGTGAAMATAFAAFKAFDTSCLSVADPDIAVGPELFGVAIQWNAYFYNKTSGLLDHSFKWEAFRGRLISDTHIVYDQSSKKWFLTTAVNLGDGVTGVQIMVSTDATAKDWRYSVPIETSASSIDNPEPTVTSDKVVITSGKCVWAVDKMALIAGNAPTVQPLTCSVAQNNQVTAVKYGGDPPATAYAIVMSDNTHINWISIEGPPTTAKVTEHLVEVPAVDEVDGITQAGKPGLQSSAVKAMWQNNHLVWNKTVRCATGACIRSFDVNTATNTVKSDDFALEGTQLFNGASGLDSSGNMWLLCSACKPDGFVGLALGGRSASGQVFQPTQIVEGLSLIDDPEERYFLGLLSRKRPRESGYPLRFGDYVGAAQDPVDGTAWLIGLYAATKGPLNRDNTAGCKVIQVIRK